MNMVNNGGLSKVFVLLAVNCVLHVQSVNANEWQDDYVSKPGFSEFSLPSGSTRYQNNIETRQWASGSSFNEENRIRYIPAVSKNPWKPVRSSFYKKTFGAKRPWGNVPDRKPAASNMKHHDQRFKQWINQQDSSYRNDAYAQPALPFSGAYGYPGLGYNSPLITPPIYPGSILSSGGYGLYPGRAHPYTGLFARPGLW